VTDTDRAPGASCRTFTLPIPGTSSLAHLEENLGAAAIDLTTEEDTGFATWPASVTGTVIRDTGA
jgi:aryl-alcohol dehydrogenase-like predicted oxidoreductase